MTDILQHAPALRPGKLQPIRRGRKRGKSNAASMFSAVLSERNNKIKKLESELRFCSQMMTKSEKLELKRRKKSALQLDTDGEKELVDRLFYNELQRRTLKAEERQLKLTQRDTIVKSSEELEATTARLYFDALRKKEETTIKLKQELEEQLQVPKPLLLEEGAIVELGLKFSTREVETRKVKREGLLHKYLPPTKPSNKFTSEAEQVASNQRLFNRSVESKQSAISRLRLKFTPEPVINRLSTAAQANMADRLSRGQSR